MLHTSTIVKNDPENSFDASKWNGFSCGENWVGGGGEKEPKP